MKYLKIFSIGLSFLLAYQQASAVMPPWQRERDDAGYYLPPPAVDQNQKLANEILETLPLPSGAPFAEYENRILERLNALTELMLTFFSEKSSKIQRSLNKSYYSKKALFTTASPPTVTHLYSDYQFVSSIDSVTSTSLQRGLSEYIEQLPILKKVFKIRYIVVEMGMKMTHFQNVGKYRYRRESEAVAKVSRMAGWAFLQDILSKIPLSFLNTEIDQGEIPSEIKKSLKEWVQKNRETSISDFLHDKLALNYPEESSSPDLQQLMEAVLKRYYASQDRHPWQMVSDLATLERAVAKPPVEVKLTKGDSGTQFSGSRVGGESQGENLPCGFYLGPSELLKEFVN
ncbi:hypothetical protein OAQ84_01900 [Bdellovibrionales bacterium]|nr:hypothetical protein [Bdellovibrionales bacterium]